MWKHTYINTIAYGSYVNLRLERSVKLQGIKTPNRTYHRLDKLERPVNCEVKIRILYHDFQAMLLLFYKALKIGMQSQSVLELERMRVGEEI